MEYLDNRAFNYATKKLNINSINKFISIEQYRALLKRIRLVSEDVGSSVDFLDKTSPEALETTLSLVETLEKKLEVLRQSARFLTKIKFETRLVAEGADVGLVDITKGTFKNVNYSITDKGIVMNSKNKIHTKSI